MWRRESRDSDPKREHPRIDREPSLTNDHRPKRSRRDGKPEAERLLRIKDLGVKHGSDSDKKPRHSLRDAAPLEPDARNPSGQGPRSSSRPYHQHDERPSADTRAISERGSWRGSTHEVNRQAEDDERSGHRKDEDKRTWHHDRFRGSDDTQGALSKKRPAFRETKITEEAGNNTDRTRTKEAKHTNLNNRRQNERNWRSNMHSERPAMGRDRAWNRDDERGAGSRQSYRADRDRFGNDGRSGFQGSWTRNVKKWDHDLFEEANKSPTKANEEEQIAKVEALLAS